MFHEKHSRTVFKTITWRIVAFGSTLIILYLLTGDFDMSLYHSILIHAAKTILYYVHERLWNRSNYGQEIRKIL